MEFSAGDMQKLVELLKPPEEQIEQHNYLPETGYDPKSTKVEITTNKINDDQIKSIEEFEEQQMQELEKASFTAKKMPEYSMVYQQDLTAEDVFLQMGPKTPSSSSCEYLTIRIKLPGVVRENVDLKVTRTIVDVSSSEYALNLPLPHPIDPDASKALWDSEVQILILTLKLDREFDFVNF